jgi:hypothetical protein
MMMCLLQLAKGRVENRELSSLTVQAES